MEVPKIDEIRLDAQVVQTDERGEVKSTEVEKRKCVYNKDMTCQVPDCKMAICEKCPYGRAQSLSSTVKDVFNKIIGMAIFLAKSDDVLRDVMVLIAKGNVENNGKEGVEGSEEREGLEGKEGGEVKEGEEAGNGERGVGIGDRGKGIENAVEVQPIVQPVNLKDVKIEALSPQKIMTKILTKKVADISEALANPNGPEKPLV